MCISRINLTWATNYNYSWTCIYEIFIKIAKKNLEIHDYFLSKFKKRNYYVNIKFGHYFF